jgi:diadenosine tetraphosphatase ApaH/serine/threonine PP2A family protein phosphatase
MRYLVLSDIHANIEALEAVLATERDFAQVLVLGDLVGYGADPNAVVDRVRDLPVAAIVRGNHDKVAAGLASVESFNPIARQAIAWTAKALSPLSLEWLAALPEGPVSVTDAIEVCHGAPFDEDFYVFDEMDAQRAAPSVTRTLCLFGHTHVPGVFRLGAGVTGERKPRHEPWVHTMTPPERALVNCGAVGQPRDGDPRAAYGVLDTDAGTVTLARVTYDVRGAQAKILAAGLPAALANRLAVGR